MFPSFALVCALTHQASHELLLVAVRVEIGEKACLGSQHNGACNRMFCTEGLFTGLTLLISMHQRMSKASAIATVTPSDCMQQLEIAVPPNATVTHPPWLPSRQVQFGSLIDDVLLASLS